MVQASLLPEDAHELGEGLQRHLKSLLDIYLFAQLSWILNNLFENL